MYLDKAVHSEEVVAAAVVYIGKVDKMLLVVVVAGTLEILMMVERDSLYRVYVYVCMFYVYMGGLYKYESS